MQFGDGSGRIVVFGDVMDDILVIPATAIRPDTDTPSQIRHRAGGSAANTAAWLGSLGAPVDFVGLVGAGDVERHAALLATSGVVPMLSGHPKLSTGAIVVVVENESRAMLTERGANSALSAEAVTDALLDDAAILHITGYSVVDSPDLPALRRLIDRAVDRGVDVAVNPGSAGYIAEFGADRFVAAIRGARLLLLNLDEGRALTRRTDPAEIVSALVAEFPVVALTLGVRGVLVAEVGGASFTVDADSVTPVDPTGAGDAFCAGFLTSWRERADARLATKAGVHAAASAVTTIGGRPTAS